MTHSESVFDHGFFFGNNFVLDYDFFFGRLFDDQGRLGNNPKFTHAFGFDVALYDFALAFHVEHARSAHDTFSFERVEFAAAVVRTVGADALVKESVLFNDAFVHVVHDNLALVQNDRFVKYLRCGLRF